MDISNFFYFDIETTGRYDSYKSLEEKDPRGADTFLRKWKRMKAAKSNGWDCDVEQAWRNNSPIYAEFGLILCMSYGYVHPRTGKLIVKNIHLIDSEEELLIKIIEVFEKIKKLGLIPTGHNIKEFDIPYIVKKIIMHELQVPSILRTYGKKPWEVNFVDTADVWRGLSWAKTSLDEITYALNVPSPKETISGEHVFETFWVAKDLPKICAYCDRDVVALYDMCKKIFSAI